MGFKLDQGSEKKLKDVHYNLQAITHLAAQISSHIFVIVQGKRTREYQSSLFQIGRRGVPGEKPVTWTMNSKHLSGNAVDFAAIVDGRISYDEKLYPPIAASFQAAAKQLGLGIVWGGTWKTKDWGHIQLAPESNVRPAGPPPRLVTLMESGVKPNDPFARPEPPVASTAYDLSVIPETNRPQWAVAYMEHLGWKKHQAAAIIAQGVWESGGNKTNDIITHALGDATTAHGGWQWRGSRYVGVHGLLSFAYGCARSSSDLEVQLLFVDKELRTTERQAGDLLRKSETLEEACEAAIGYCRPRGFKWDKPRDGHGFDRRLEIARGLMK